MHHTEQQPRATGAQRSGRARGVSIDIKVVGLLVLPLMAIVAVLTVNVPNQQFDVLVRTSILIGVGALLFGVVATWLIVHSMVRRVRAIAAAASAVTAGELDGAVVVDDSSDEIGTLARAFNAMLERLQGSISDIQETAREEKSAAAEYLEDIYRTMPGSLLVFDRDGKIDVVNAACEQLLEYDDGTLEGQPIDSILDAGAALDCAEIVALAARGGVLRTEKVWRTRSGTRIPVMLSATPIRKPADGEWSGIVCVARDLSDRKRLEQELHQAHKLELVGRLASGVAHEINTPIQFVNDSVHFAGEAVGELAVVIAKYREVTQAVLADVPAREAAQAAIETEAQVDLDFLLTNLPPALERSLEGIGRVATIVRSMKAFAHPDRIEMTASELNPAILATLTVASNELKYVAEVETDLGELPLVMCHLGEINQVVLNVAVNAAHAIGDMVRGTDRRGHITVRTRDHGDSVTIEIEDDGGGIPEAVRERIFDPFFTTKEVGRGTGQGLAIARSVIHDKHGGQLTFATETGRGTTFTIRLPVAGALVQAA